MAHRIETNLAIFHRRRYLLALVFVGGCFFNADYGDGHYTCGDGICPSGLVCVQGECVTERKDAAVDTQVVIDAPPRAATCTDPQPFPPTGGMTAGTTMNRTNTVSSSCDGSVMNGADAVYKIDSTMPVLVTVTGSFTVTAYALTQATCTATPSTPTCIGNTAATPGNPISVPAGLSFIVVDSANPAASGDYTLKLEVQ